MAYHRQEEPLVSEFQPASSVYGVSLSELTELNEVSDNHLPEGCHAIVLDC